MTVPEEVPTLSFPFRCCIAVDDDDNDDDDVDDVRARPDRRKSTCADSDASPRSPSFRHVRKVDALYVLSRQYSCVRSSLSSPYRVVWQAQCRRNPIARPPHNTTDDDDDDDDGADGDDDENNAEQGEEQEPRAQIKKVELLHDGVNFISCSTLSVPNCHATRSKHEGWDTARLPKPRHRGSREAEVGFEPRTFRPVNLRSNHLGHLAPYRWNAFHHNQVFVIRLLNALGSGHCSAFLSSLHAIVNKSLPFCVCPSRATEKQCVRQSSSQRLETPESLMTDPKK
ncbi:hypothetical protein T265_08240 [Opisthorchis viverrini]|uniref:Uncharacterized protein n=1 Tax=Opisthorchis viverrini TaxID=6198 RepID=A0A074ZKV5_OPIVI|nr:hypothetical protein T265_08240 [Opisthorchis viverrini]KER23995.1 hypothetical protein T265_08240 [Opisthorchis viverrini]